MNPTLLSSRAARRRLRKVVFLATTIAALVGGGGCDREISDATAAAPRVTGNAPWTVDGVRPGEGLDDAKRILGEPRELREVMGQRVAHWSGRETMVTVDQAGRVVEVWGRSLKIAGRRILSPGVGEAEIVAALGKSEVRNSYRPKGSGVISLGREQTSRTFVYENGGVCFEITEPKDGLGYIRAYFRIK